MGIKQGGKPLDRDDVGKLGSLNLPKDAEIRDKHMIHVAALPAVRAINLSNTLLTDAGMPALRQGTARTSG